MLNKGVNWFKKFFAAFPLMFLQVVLNVGLIFIILGCILEPIYTIVRIFVLSSLSMFTIKASIFIEINSLIYVFIIFELRNIIERIAEEKAFIIDNVKSFRRIGMYIVLIGIVDVIDGVISESFKAVLVFYKDGSIKPDILLFIVIACVCFVIAEVFEKAIQIKKDNDLTI